MRITGVTGDEASEGQPREMTMGTASKEQIARYKADPEYRAAMEHGREIQEQIRPFMIALEQRTPLTEDELKQLEALNAKFRALIKRATKAIARIAVDSGVLTKVKRKR